MDIAIVTSAWGDYAKFLPDWAQSIADQTLRPAEVAIIDAGCDHPEDIGNALGILYGAGIRLQFDTFERTTLGSARNAATALATTEWVMHLDADDMLLPGCIEDVAARQDTADVISFGCIRNGQSITFSSVSTEAVLQGQMCAYSCAAFRKSFWARRPWQTRNDWCDSTYWVGLAHLGARFTTTGNTGFIYRQHEDSVSHTISAEDKRFAVEQYRRACQRWEFEAP